MIWSDPEIQKLAQNFVCVVEECFFLHPPSWLQNPPNPDSTNLFKTYVSNAPDLWPANTPTHQGLYVMTADGGFLSGDFARQSLENARAVIEAGWDSWKRKNHRESKPVPRTGLPLFAGAPPPPGGLKLQVTYRDLPRGETRRPGDAQFPNPYNMGWYDLTPQEAKSFVNDSPQPREVPLGIVQKLALTKLKDAVRGQMNGWKPTDWKGGRLKVEQDKKAGSVVVCRISGNVDLRRGNSLSYAPKFFGHAVYDQSTGEFIDFQMLATGQRTGRGGANGRNTDLGPAPMAIAFRMYRP